MGMAIRWNTNKPTTSMTKRILTASCSHNQGWEGEEGKKERELQ